MRSMLSLFPKDWLQCDDWLVVSTNIQVEEAEAVTSSSGLSKSCGLTFL